MVDHSEDADETLGAVESSDSPKLRGLVLLPLWRHMLGDELRRLRHELGETLEETARNAGISPQYLSEMERGVKDPSSEMIAAVAGALRVTLIDLTRAVSEQLQTAASEREQLSQRPSAARYVGLALAA